MYSRENHFVIIDLWLGAGLTFIKIPGLHMLKKCFLWIISPSDAEDCYTINCPDRAIDLLTNGIPAAGVKKIPNQPLYGLKISQYVSKGYKIHWNSSSFKKIDLTIGELKLTLGSIISIPWVTNYCQISSEGCKNFKAQKKKAYQAFNRAFGDADRFSAKVSNWNLKIVTARPLPSVREYYRKISGPQKCY